MTHRTSAFCVFAALLTLALPLSGQTTVTIGTGTDTSNFPLYDYDTHSRSQALYLASEIGIQGSITKLRWYRDNTGADPDAIGLTEIWLRQYIPDTLATPDWEEPGTLVASIGNIDLGNGGGWYEIDITDFEYSGANLLVSVRTQDAPYVSPHASWRGTYIYPQHLSRESHDYEVNPPDYMVYGNLRPNLQLEIETLVPTAPPNPAVAPEPANAATGVLADASLRWYSGGGMPTGFRLFLGTDNPPSNLVNGTDLGNAYSYDPPGELAYGQTHYWQIVPYNAIGNAAACPVWSFSTVSAITGYPYHYGFEETFYPPEGWSSIIDQGASGFQQMEGSPSSPSAGPHTDSWLGYYNCRALSNGSKARLISPPVSRIDPDYEYTLTFWMYRDIGWSTRADRINIWLGGRDLGAATLLGTIHRNKGMEPIETGSSGWYEYSFPLAAGATDFISFEGVSANGNNILIDDIYLSRIPLGGTPPGLATAPHPADGETNAAPDVILSWTAPDGEVTDYVVRVYDASDVLQFSTQTTQTSLPLVNAGYSETYRWEVDPGNGAGYASSVQQLPRWTFTTLPPDVPGIYPADLATDVNVYNKLLDWNPLAGADSYVVNAGTTPGGTDIADGVPVTGTKYLCSLDHFSQSSNVWWQVKPVRNGVFYEGTWHQFTTGGIPPVPVPLNESFDSLTPPDLPQGWRKIVPCLRYNTIATVPNSQMSPPNAMLFNIEYDPANLAALYTQPLNPALREWKAMIDFDAYSTYDTELLVEVVSDQSDSPQVYASQTVSISPQPVGKSVSVTIPGNTAPCVRFRPPQGDNQIYVDNAVIYQQVAGVPVDFRIVKAGGSLKLMWNDMPDNYYYIYRVYSSSSPNGPFTLLDSTTNTPPGPPEGIFEYDLNQGDGPARFYHVTAEYFNPWSPEF
jgi:hypothetical protein